ncbi:MAG: MBL fold metallo-hydrolase [candidate division Zixibacteria bacterium]|nr:MBL fold metallo-hydrolase [candidate division Zixibacteria bacterium]
MKISTIVVGPFAVNCYLLWDDNGEGVIIDPGAEKDKIIETVNKAGFSPKAILLTHGHGDHIAAVADIKAKYNIPLYIGNGEEDLLKNPSANVSAYFDEPIIAPDADYLLEDKQIIKFGSIEFQILSTPGHSPAGICYLNEKENLLFTGDTLFAGSIGRTDFPGCSTEKLLSSIREKILVLPDGIICFPGHGSHTTVGTERNSNPFLVGGDFV